MPSWPHWPPRSLNAQRELSANNQAKYRSEFTLGKAGWLGREVVAPLRRPFRGPLATPPTPHGRDRGLEPAPAPGLRVGPSETRFQLSEHPLAAGLGCVVGVVAQVLV